MTERTALTGAEVQSVAADLVAAQPLLGTGPPQRVAGQLGWSVRDVEPDLGLIVQTGYRAPGGRAELWVDDGTVIAILVDLTGTEVGGGRAAADFRRDVFADAARALEAVYGEPAERNPGRLPEIRWRLPGGTTLLLRHGRFSVGLLLTRPGEDDVDDVEVPA